MTAFNITIKHLSSRQPVDTYELEAESEELASDEAHLLLQQSPSYRYGHYITTEQATDPQEEPCH